MRRVWEVGYEQGYITDTCNEHLACEMITMLKQIDLEQMSEHEFESTLSN